MYKYNGEKVCLINASPHIGGVTDSLCAYILKSISAECSLLYMRDARIEACTHCGYCERYVQQCSPERYTQKICPLHSAQDIAYFEAVLYAELCIVVAPIYFYHLPACFKSFIDRAQAVYEFHRESVPQAPHIEKKVYPILHAGREKGSSLFTGSLRTVRYFAEAFGYILGEPLTIRGTDIRNIDETVEKEIQIYCSRNIIF